MEEALFIAHFIEGKNVGDINTLVDIAGSLGINTDEARKVLTSEEFDDEVKHDFSEAKDHGISGVPFFILNGKYAVSGAQPVDFFAGALQQTYDETVAPLKNLSGDDNSCGTDGCSI